ncbi:MAG: hypothetical protein ACRDDX_05960 [Cellulosilyticaceae bacterium]
MNADTTSKLWFLAAFICLMIGMTGDYTLILIVGCACACQAVSTHKKQNKEEVDGQKETEE